MPGTPNAARFSRRDLLKGAASAGIGIVSGSAAYGFLYERHHIGLTQEIVRVSGLPRALAGLRVGFFSDLHRSQTVPHSMIATAVSMVMEHQPDIIILGGDYVSFRDRRYVGPVAEALAPLTAPHGIFAVIGNHDDERDVPAALGAKGIVVLKDARTRLMIKGEALEIAGIRYWTSRPVDIGRVLRGAASNVILVAHTPMRLTEAAAFGVPLVLSGHTHGGQIVLPGLGAVAAREFPVVAGQGRREGTGIFVTRGVGTVYVPVRLNCPPEVAILTLQPFVDL